MQVRKIPVSGAARKGGETSGSESSFYALGRKRKLTIKSYAQLSKEAEEQEAQRQHQMQSQSVSATMSVSSKTTSKGGNPSSAREQEMSDLEDAYAKYLKKFSQRLTREGYKIL